MPVNIIDTLKPKNNGTFPIVEAVDVAVSADLRLPEALAAKADASALAEIDSAVAAKANASDVDTATANLQGQINQIEISASSEAVVAPEVAAARVGADATSYTTLKERLDAEQDKQSADILAVDAKIDKMLVSTKNLFNSDWEEGAISLDTGNDIVSASSLRSDFITVEYGKTYTLSGKTEGANAPYVIFYDSSKQPVTVSGNIWMQLSAAAVGTLWYPKTFSLPNNSSIKFIRFTMSKIDIEETQFEVGTVASDYIPPKIISEEYVEQLEDVVKTDDIFKSSKNLFASEWTEGEINVETGAENASSVSLRSDFIPVEYGETYTLSGETEEANAPYVFLYDSEKSPVTVDGNIFIRLTNQTIGTLWYPKTFSIPNRSSIAYIRFSMTKIDIEKTQFEKGGIATAYVPPKVIDPDLIVTDDSQYVKRDELFVQSKNVFDSEWIEGAINLDTGVDIANDNYLRSDFLQIQYGRTYTLSCETSEANAPYVIFYNSSKEPVEINNSIAMHLTGDVTGSLWYPKTFDIPNDSRIAFIRFSMIKIELDKTQLELGSTATAYVAPQCIPSGLVEDNFTGTTYTMTYDGTDLSLEDSKGNVQTVTISGGGSSDLLHHSKNIGMTWENKGINLDTGANDDSDTNKSRTNYIPVEGGKTFAFDMNECQNAYAEYVFYYTSNKTPILIDTDNNRYWTRLTSGWFPKTLEIPTGKNIAFIRLLQTTAGTDKTHSQCEENTISTTYRSSSANEFDTAKMPNSASGFIGKDIVVLGDSITAMETTGGWLPYFKASTKPNTCNNYAVGGSSWCDSTSGVVYDGRSSTENSIGNQVYNAVAANLPNVDCIIISAGTNDTNVTNPSDADIEAQFYNNDMTIKPLSDVDRTTWEGAMRYTVETLKNKYPLAKIFICTPVQRYYVSDEPVRSLYSTIKTKNEIIKKMCMRLGIECIDTEACGISGMSEFDFVDRFHLKPWAAKKLSRYIISRYMQWFNVE